MKNYNLKPCPVCRGKGELKEYITPHDTGYRILYIRCTNCDLLYGKIVRKENDIKKLVIAWNRRKWK